MIGLFTLLVIDITNNMDDNGSTFKLSQFIIDHCIYGMNFYIFVIIWEWQYIIFYCVYLTYHGILFLPLMIKNWNIESFYKINYHFNKLYSNNSYQFQKNIFNYHSNQYYTTNFEKLKQNCINLFDKIINCIKQTICNKISLMITNFDNYLNQKRLQRQQQRLQQRQNLQNNTDNNNQKNSNNPKQTSLKILKSNQKIAKITVDSHSPYLTHTTMIIVITITTTFFTNNKDIEWQYFRYK